MSRKLFIIPLLMAVIAIASAFETRVALGYTADELLKLTNQIQNENPGIKIEIRTDKEEYKVGEDVAIRFKADKDCYLALIDIGTSGKTLILFPNKWHSDNKIEKDKSYTIPPIGGDFAYKVLPPAGIEHIKVIATEDPVLSKVQSLQEELKQPIETSPDKGQVFLTMKDPGVVIKDIGVVFQKLDPKKWATKEHTFKISEATAERKPTPDEPPSAPPTSRPVEGSGIFKGKDGFYEIRYDSAKWQNSPGPGDVIETVFNHKTTEADVVVMSQAGKPAGPMESVKQAFLENLKGVASDIVVKEDKEIKVNNTPINYMVVSGKTENAAYTFHAYLWKGDSGVVEVVGSSPEKNFSQVKDDMEKFLNGLVILKP